MISLTFSDARSVQGGLPIPNTLVSPKLAQTQRLSKLAWDLAGLNLKPEKLEFFGQRLGKNLKSSGCRSYDEYIQLLSGPGGNEDRVRFVEALTTHTTNFFREERHFDFLLETGFDALMAMRAGLDRPLAIWSAASSNGAELYSILMAAHEFMERRQTKLNVVGVGTDISTPILKKARSGVYSASEIGGLSEDRRRKFLLRDRSGAPRFRVDPVLRNLCKWQQLNLTDKSISGPRGVDVIFLRNVLIYFDVETRQRVVETLASRLNPGGYLFTGHSETLVDCPPGLAQESAAVYRKGGG